MRTGLRLRFRLYAMILPLVVVVVALSGILASLESRVALTRLANRHLAYKAEQLRDYFFSEWDVITKLGLNGDPSYRAATEESLRSYAFSLLRSPTERVFAFDSHGLLVMSLGLEKSARDDLRLDGSANSAHLAPGWFSKTVLGRPRVGVAFDIQPLGWTVAVTELPSTFFADVANIQRIQIAILAASVAVVTLFLSIFIGYVTRPVERLARTIEHITATNDLAQRVGIDFNDEIGSLALRFNAMIATLESKQRQLETTIEAEKVARRTAVAREEETLLVLGRVSDFRDEETGAHLRRIAELSALMSKLLGQPEEEQNLIRQAAPLHDVGKIGVPDAVMHKEGPLTVDEADVMRRHALLGFNLLKDARSIYLVEGAKIALTHHERWDGSGYPSGLAGEQIPLSGRIVSIVDVFDALTSARPYKSAWDSEHALQYIVEQRGMQFDPRLVDVFAQNFPLFVECLKRSGNGFVSDPLRAPKRG